MTAKLYYTTTNKSFRDVAEHLRQNNISYVTQNLKTESLSWEQLLEILMHTDNGIEDLLSLRAKEYTELVQQGVDFDELTLTQFHELVVSYPRIIRSPILVAKKTTLIGYNVEEMSLLKNRKDRKTEHMKILSMLQVSDSNNLDNTMYAY